MREGLAQNASQTQSSKPNIFLRTFSFLIPLLDVIKLVIASVTSVVFLAFAGLTLAVSAIALIVSTPVFIIFSPILVPATLATTFLATGLTAGTTLGLIALSLIMGLIRSAETPSLARRMPMRGMKIQSGAGGNRAAELMRKRIQARIRGGGMAGGGGTHIPDWFRTMIKQAMSQRMGGGGGQIPQWFRDFIKKAMSGGIGGGGMGGGGATPEEGAKPEGGATPEEGAKPEGGATPEKGAKPEGGADAAGGADPPAE